MLCVLGICCCCLQQRIARKEVDIYVLFLQFCVSLSLPLCCLWAELFEEKYKAYCWLREPMHQHGTRQISVHFCNSDGGCLEQQACQSSGHLCSLPFSQLADSSGHMCVDTAFVGPDSSFQRLARITAGHGCNQTVTQWRNHIALVGIQRETLCHLLIRECLYSLLD